MEVNDSRCNTMHNKNIYSVYHSLYQQVHGYWCVDGLQWQTGVRWGEWEPGATETAEGL